MIIIWDLLSKSLRLLLLIGKESEISSQIMQFLDAQLDTGNSNICKEDIARILNSILVDDFSDSFHSAFDEKRIAYCFPEICDIKIESGNAALLFEKVSSPIYGSQERSAYLFVSPDFYNDNIIKIEAEIKKLEKNFSRQDFRNFENKFNEDLGIKQYEFESARVYESASNQIEQKKQKFNNVSSKLINDYGRKYDEIASKDIPEDEKALAFKKLLAETKSYDEKNRQAVARLNAEYEQLAKDFQGKIQASDTTYKQMQNLHLFDKNRYFEDMMSAIEPKLQELYKKRFLLNSYRTQHNETVYDGRPNVFKHFANAVFSHLKFKNSPLMLGPHFERDFNNRKSG